MAKISVIKDRIRQMSPAGFQILCDDYLSRIGYPDLVSLGTMAGSEKTTKGTPDTYFIKKNGKYIFAEYTTTTENLIKKIQSDIDKCLDEKKTGIPAELITEIVYCHTSSQIPPADEKKLKDLCGDRGILLNLIGIDKLADDLFWKYKILVKEHLGLTIDTEQIQTAEEFIKQYDSNTLAATLETAFLFRKEEWDRLTEAFSEYDVVIIKGAAGVGKTRFALEYAKKHAIEAGEQFYCIHSRQLGLFDDLSLYFDQPNHYFIMVDDANQLSEFHLLIDLINRKREQSTFKLLITVRDYAAKTVKRALSGSIRFTELTLDKLKDEEIKRLVKDHYGIQNEDYLERIAIIAEGNARIAMLAGKIAVNTNRLNSISDAGSLYEEYYGPLLQSIELDQNSSLLVTAGVAAFLNSFHLDYIEPIVLLLEREGITRDEFMDSLDRLSNLEVVDIYHNKAVCFSEQVFANFILKYVFYDKKAFPLSEIIGTWFFQNKEKTIFAVNTLTNLFQSEDVHRYVTSEIKKIWNQLKENDPQRFWAFFNSFYPVNPVEALSILKEKIDSIDPVEIIVDRIDTETGKNHQNITDDIISILSGYAEDHADLDAALDLFFLYYRKRPDMYMQFYHASVNAFCIKKDSSRYGYHTQIRFFTKLYEYSDDWNDECFVILFLDLAKEFLRFEFSPYSSTRSGRGINIYRIPLQPSEQVVAYRSLIWKEVNTIAVLGKQKKYVRNLLKNYGHGSGEDSEEIIKCEAPEICKIILECMKANSIEDCLVVSKISHLFLRFDIPIDIFSEYLQSPVMKNYNILAGADLDADYDYEKKRKDHENRIKAYLLPESLRFERFLQLLDVFCSIPENEYMVTTGISIALQALQSNGDEYAKAASIIMSSGKYEGIDICTVVEGLFSWLKAPDVYKLIQDNTKSDVARNVWLYAYYHEIPEEHIDHIQTQCLYEYLLEESDKSIRRSSFRDIAFLEKYKKVDSQVVIKASRIILSKGSYSPFIPHLYFYSLFGFHRDRLDIFQLFAGNLELLEDIYFFLLHYKAHPDLKGDILLKLLQIDEAMPDRLARELLIEAEAHSLNEVETKYCVLYQLSNYIEILDAFTNAAIQYAKYPCLVVPRIIKHFIIAQDKPEDISEKQVAWILHYISDNAFDSTRMDCLFEALTESSEDLRRKSIEAFIRHNPNFDAFSKLDILPNSYSSFGSFVPVFSGWIDFLQSLLPLFTGIQYLAHKNLIIQRIDSLRQRIINEEISDAVTR